MSKGGLPGKISGKSVGQQEQREQGLRRELGAESGGYGWGQVGRSPWRSMWNGRVSGGGGPGGGAWELFCRKDQQDLVMRPAKEEEELKMTPRFLAGKINGEYHLLSWRKTGRNRFRNKIRNFVWGIFRYRYWC